MSAGRFVFISLAVLVAGAGRANATPIGFTYSTISFPGANETRAYGINNSGKIVGGYHEAIAQPYAGWFGFLDAGGILTSIIPFDNIWAETAAYGISDSGKIVGYYDNYTKYYGYLGVKGSYSLIDAPASVGTLAYGINNSGSIVGWFEDSRIHGFSYTGESFTPIDVLGSSLTYAYDINNRGDIVGTYRHLDVIGGRLVEFHGFLYTGEGFGTIDVPGSYLSYAQGINNSGDIVGYYQDATGKHGFLYTGGSFTAIDVPGSSNTYAYGINDRGQIVGWYSDDVGIYGFLATPIPEPSTLALLGVCILGLIGYGWWTKTVR